MHNAVKCVDVYFVVKRLLYYTYDLEFYICFYLVFTIIFSLYIIIVLYNLYFNYFLIFSIT